MENKIAFIYAEWDEAVPNLVQKFKKALAQFNLKLYTLDVGSADHHLAICSNDVTEDKAKTAYDEEWQRLESE